MSQKRFSSKETEYDCNVRKTIARGADVIPTSATPFYATRAMFRNYINYDKPLSYDEWMSVDDDKKAAVLYVQFFEQISLAWYKLKTKAAIEEECVSEVLMYLVKNVPIIKENPSRFKPSYIYRVVYNCIYCKSMDPYNGQTAKTSWYNNTTSQYVQAGDDIIDIFETICDTEDIDIISAREHFWKIVESMGDDTLAVVDQLLNGTRLPAGVGAKKKQIIEELKVSLLAYKEVFLG